MYHCSPSWLESGSIIRPGNYGRILKMNGARHAHWLREQFIELIRVYEFPDKPSRFTSAFTCEHLDAIRLFKEGNCPMGIVYEVELVNPDANRHTDFNCIRTLRDLHTANTEMCRDLGGNWLTGCSGGRFDVTVRLRAQLNEPRQGANHQRTDEASSRRGIALNSHDPAWKSSPAQERQRATPSYTPPRGGMTTPLSVAERQVNAISEQSDSGARDQYPLHLDCGPLGQ